MKPMTELDSRNSIIRRVVMNVKKYGTTLKTIFHACQSFTDHLLNYRLNFDPKSQSFPDPVNARGTATGNDEGIQSCPHSFGIYH